MYQIDCRLLQKVSVSFAVKSIFLDAYLLFTDTCVGAESGFFHWIRDLVDELIVSMTQEAELSEEVRNLFITSHVFPEVELCTFG